MGNIESQVFVKQQWCNPNNNDLNNPDFIVINSFTGPVMLCDTYKITYDSGLVMYKSIPAIYSKLVFAYEDENREPLEIQDMIKGKHF